MTTRDVHLPRRHPTQTQVIREARRFNVLCNGRRWGKTTLGIDLLTAHPSGALDGHPVAWFAPNSKLFDEVWRETTRRLAPAITRADSQKNRIDLITGGSIDFWTLHNTDDPGRGRAYKRIFIDEAAIVPTHRLEAQWNEAIRPTLTDYAGEAWFASTPKGLNYYQALYQRGQDPSWGDWASWQLPTSTNPHIPPTEIEAARLELDDATFRQEYLAEFIHEFGAIFKTPRTYTPDELPPTGREATGCDFAYTRRGGDYTVFLQGRAAPGTNVVGENTTIIFITDAYRSQEDATSWAPALQQYPRPFAFIGGQEKAIAGFLRKDYAVSIRTETAGQDKLARARPAQAAWNRGEILLPQAAPWLEEIQAEIMSFTGTTDDPHDDIVDALAALHHALIGDTETFNLRSF